MVTRPHNSSSRRTRASASNQRVIQAQLGPKDGSHARHISTSFAVRLDNIGATAQRILDRPTWESGTAVHELSALKINRQGGEIKDPRNCLSSGISNHPHIREDNDSYAAYMPNNDPLPEECLSCVISALLALSGRIQEVQVRTDLL